MMIMDFMKLMTVVLFIFVLVFPVFYIVYIAIRDRKIHKRIRQYKQEIKFYKTNYIINEHGTKKLNGAWHK